jgi:hypothetical protein
MDVLGLRRFTTVAKRRTGGGKIEKESHRTRLFAANNY